jgi:hypothetical protein
MSETSLEWLLIVLCVVVAITASIDGVSWLAAFYGFGSGVLLQARLAKHSMTHHHGPCGRDADLR